MKGGMQNIRDTYRVPAKRGGRVVYSGDPYRPDRKGTITGTSQNGQAYIRLRLDGNNYSQNYHPTWQIEYLPDGAE